MTAQNPPSYLEAGSHPANLDRQLIETIMPTQGVVDRQTGALLVTEQSPTAMGVTVAAGKAVVTGTEADSQGAYHVVNDAAVDLAVAASDPTNARIDLVVARVRDAFYSGAVNAWSLDVVTGTPSGTPAEPTVPANAVALARVYVAAGATEILTADLTDRRVRSLVRGELIARISMYATTTFSPADYPGLRNVLAKVQAGGGAGGGTAATGGAQSACGAGGAGGNYSESLLAVADLESSVSVTVGPGGPGASGAAGGTGATSQFGAHVLAYGGTGGRGMAASTSAAIVEGGTAGAAGVGDLQIYGQGGAQAVRVSGANREWIAGLGGSSHMGGGGPAGLDFTGGAGGQYGGGGGGSGCGNGQSTRAGGGGGDGVVILDLYA